jgi:hypothetical protein
VYVHVSEAKKPRQQPAMHLTRPIHATPLLNDRTNAAAMRVAQRSSGSDFSLLLNLHTCIQKRKRGEITMKNGHPAGSADIQDGDMHQCMQKEQTEQWNRLTARLARLLA